MNKKIIAVLLAATAAVSLAGCTRVYAENTNKGRVALTEIGDICDKYGGEISSGTNSGYLEATIKCTIPQENLE